MILCSGCYPRLYLNTFFSLGPIQSWYVNLWVKCSSEWLCFIPARLFCKACPCFYNVMDKQLFLCISSIKLYQPLPIKDLAGCCRMCNDHSYLANSDLVDHLINQPRTLPVKNNLVTLPYSKELRPLRKKQQLIACCLSATSFLKEIQGTILQMSWSYKTVDHLSKKMGTLLCQSEY